MIKVSDIGLHKTDYTKEFHTPNLVKLFLDTQREYEDQYILKLFKNVKCPICNEYTDWRIVKDFYSDIPKMTCCKCDSDFELSEGCCFTILHFAKQIFRTKNDNHPAFHEEYKISLVKYMRDYINKEARKR